MSNPTYTLELNIEKVTVPEKVSKGLEIKLEVGKNKKTLTKPFSQTISLEVEDISEPLQVTYLIQGE